jgi:hypothetical protein
MEADGQEADGQEATETWRVKKRHHMMRCRPAKDPPRELSQTKVLLYSSFLNSTTKFQAPYLYSMWMSYVI